MDKNTKKVQTYKSQSSLLKSKTTAAAESNAAACMDKNKTIKSNVQVEFHMYPNPMSH